MHCVYSPVNLGWQPKYLSAFTGLKIRYSNLCRQALWTIQLRVSCRQKYVKKCFLTCKILDTKTTFKFLLHFMHIYIYIYIQWKKMYPLLILYVCPLTKKWSVYNFNGRFIWTVRDRITTKKIQKNAFQKSYKLICILMSEISIWSPINQQDFWLPGVFYTGKELRLGGSLKWSLSLLPV